VVIYGKTRSGAGALSFTGTGARHVLASISGTGVEVIFMGTGTASVCAAISGAGALGPHLTPPQYLWMRARRRVTTV
jgi:hypothetical protein